MLDWILTLLRLLPKDPDRTAEEFKRSSSALGERLRPWLYGLIGCVVLLLLVAVCMLLAN